MKSFEDILNNILKETEDKPVLKVTVKPAPGGIQVSSGMASSFKELLTTEEQIRLHEATRAFSQAIGNIAASNIKVIEWVTGEKYEAQDGSNCENCDEKEECDKRKASIMASLEEDLPRTLSDLLMNDGGPVGMRLN